MAKISRRVYLRECQRKRKLLVGNHAIWIRILQLLNYNLFLFFLIYILIIRDIVGYKLIMITSTGVCTWGSCLHQRHRVVSGDNRRASFLSTLTTVDEEEFLISRS